jgi:hypothetical protein
LATGEESDSDDEVVEGDSSATMEVEAASEEAGVEANT